MVKVNASGAIQKGSIRGPVFLDFSEDMASEVRLRVAIDFGRQALIVQTVRNKLFRTDIFATRS